MTTTYDSKRSVTLTLSQWLTISSALFDAIEHNQGRYPVITNDIRKARLAMVAPINEALDAAHEYTTEQLAKFKKESV